MIIKKKKHHYFLKLIIIFLVFALMFFYAYKFPVTMELIDKNINKILSFSGRDSDFSVFSDISVFTKKAVNNAEYIYEIIKENIGEIKKDTKQISGILISFPAAFPTKTTDISSFFGKRNDPISGKEDMHTGIDIAAFSGEEVSAAWPGKIFETGSDNIYGNYIIIEHSDNFYTKYCHLSKICVECNSLVFAKEKIGEVGNTGRTTGSHLHFEVILGGRHIDPKECFAT